jgi:hypothetical protein
MQKKGPPPPPWRNRSYLDMKNSRCVTWACWRNETPTRFAMGEGGCMASILLLWLVIRRQLPECIEVVRRPQLWRFPQPTRKTKPFRPDIGSVQTQLAWILRRSISTNGAPKEVFGAGAERRTAGSEQRTSHVRRHSKYDILQLVSRSSEETVDLLHADWQVALRSWGPFLKSK